MATSKGGNGSVATDDFADSLEEADPIGRATSEREHAAFVANPRVLEIVQQRFAAGKAVLLKTLYATEKDARAGAKVLQQHGFEVAGQMDPPKSAAIRVFQEGDQWRAQVELTHKRVAKVPGEATDGEATPDGEATGEAPAETPAE